MNGTGNPPTNTGRFTFESDGFRYEVFRALLEHVDYVRHTAQQPEAQSE